MVLGPSQSTAGLGAPDHHLVMPAVSAEHELFEQEWVQTSEHLELRTDLAVLLHCLNGLPQEAGVGRWEGYRGGVACCIVQDEGGEGVKQEDGGARCHQCRPAQGVARVGLQQHPSLVEYTDSSFHSNNHCDAKSI